MVRVTVFSVPALWRWNSTPDHVLNKLKAGMNSGGRRLDRARGPRVNAASGAASSSSLPVKSGGVAAALAEARAPAQQLQRALVASFSCILLQRPPLLSQGFAAGWDVVLPAAWAPTMWLALVHGGATAVRE